MSRSRVRRRWVAWLALAAMWLAIAAPVISQTLPTAWAMPDLGPWCGGHAYDATSPSTPPHDHLLEKCAYCGLLSESPTLTSTAWLPALLPLMTAMPPFETVAPPWTHLSPLAAAPRGPPGFAHV
ncbi:DUF2946 domain-containing protein [Dyella silvae]|uniref:DUF2946 domain-containing protein n=1 Tax=Dyella silvae TaxID=2994424 RepID=UPI002264AAE8|nr:DUF2946 domain-containing protein [Dyella silvae]